MSKHTEHIAFFIRQKLQLPALYVRAAALLLLALLLLRHRTAAAAGVVSGIHTCLGTLIPSLFPFILLACLCTNSRAAQVLFRPLSPVMRHVFRLPACAAPAVCWGSPQATLPARRSPQIYTRPESSQGNRRRGCYASVPRRAMRLRQPIRAVYY